MRALGPLITIGALAFSVDAIAAHDSVVTQKTVGFATAAQGFYFADGSNFSGSVTIDEGNRNNYFVFDLSGVDLTNLKSASLYFNDAVGYTTTNELNYKIFDVTHGVNELVSGNVNTSIYDDLQSGVEYASANAVDFPDYVNFELNFNQVGLNAIKAANGLFAFGGTLTSRTPGGDSELFIGPIYTGLYLTFNVTPVPEADTYAMFLAGLGLLAISIRRRNE